MSTARVPATLPPFADLLDRARRWAKMTEAEFDYGLAYPSHDSGYSDYAGSPVDAYQVAITGLVEHPAGADAPIQDLVAPTEAIYEHYRAEYVAHVAAAKARGFTGWSNAARSRGHKIRYADLAPGPGRPRIGSGRKLAEMALRDDEGAAIDARAARDGISVAEAVRAMIREAAGLPGVTDPGAQG
ncbi:hypothetical protein [Pseudonocardia sp. HH130630-07]|uniref:hypothetical protein n=1 Tax=Pseudonocardia sp. HH130630-07 TaxID=1690815 RepID=UPI0012E9EB08|nr:hypothetical protein [Pseudonocardia sp. HH130630-07]